MRVASVCLVVLTILYVLYSSSLAVAQVEAREITVVAGHWHVFKLPPGWVGATVYSPEYGSLTTYVWDINTSYIIFYSPFSGSAYVIRSTIQNQVLNTKSWFPPKPVILNVSVRTMVVTGQTTYMTRTDKFYHRNGVTASVTHVFTGSSIVVTNTSWFDISRTGSMSMSTTAPASSGSTYNVLLELRVNATAQRLSINCTWLNPYVEVYMYPSYEYINNAWGISTTQYRGVTKSIGNAVGSDTDTLVNSNNYIYVTGTIISEQVVRNHLYLEYSLRVRTYASSTRTYTAVNNVITAANGNKIYIVPYSIQISLATAREASLLVYASEYTISKNSTSSVLGLMVPKPNNVLTLNPALYVPSVGVLPTFYYVNGSNVFMIAQSELLRDITSTSVYVVWDIPRHVFESIRITPVNASVSEIFILVEGTVFGSETLVFSNAQAVVAWGGSSLALMSLAIASGESTISKLVINGFVFYSLKPGSYIRGNFTISPRVVLIDVPELFLDINTYITYTYVAEGYTSIPFTYVLKTSVANPRGSWGYRVPIYITFNSQTVTQPVIRLELPLGVYIRNGLLSSGLEDLLFTDATNTPLFFHVRYWKDTTTAVVYVRLRNPVQAGFTTIYMYMYNRNLWGTGTTYQSIETYDFVNPEMPFSISGVWTGYSLTDVKEVVVYTTGADYLKINVSEGVALECHGSLCTQRTLPIIPAGFKELLVVVKDTQVWFFADGNPEYSIDFNNYGDFQKTYNTKVSYISTDARAMYVFHMVDYTYSVGSIVGSVNQPAQHVDKKQSNTPVYTMDWGSLFLMIFALIGLGIAVRLFTSSTGGGGGGVLSRF